MICVSVFNALDEQKGLEKVILKSFALTLKGCVLHYKAKVHLGPGQNITI